MLLPRLSNGFFMKYVKASTSISRAAWTLGVSFTTKTIRSL